MALGKGIIKELAAIVGKDRCSADREDLICYGYDAFNQSTLPELLLFPSSAEEISRIMTIANQEKIPVVPRGAGTGYTGGAVPVMKGLVLSLEKMERILSIDADNLVATVEPGVVTGKFQEEVEKLGLFYPPDPASLEVCTLGGNVAECAGGPRALKYGVTKNYVIGLEVVLPTGEISTTGVKTMKGVVGYDLTKLLVGSEGTLGVITKIIFRLIPLPEARRTLMAIFPQVVQAARTVSHIIRERILPAKLEIMDGDCIRCVEDYLHAGLPVEAEALLLIEVDGQNEAIARESDKIAGICREEGAQKVQQAENDEEAELLWKARRSVSPSLVKLNPHKINEDITVPRAALPEALERIRAIAKQQNLKCPCFGHAGDGNIHVNLMINRENQDEVERAHQAVRQIFQVAVDLEGTLSGEHGVGIAKAPYLKMELGNLGLDVMKRIKKSFDPNNIMNPGKIFPDELPEKVLEQMGLA